MAQEHLAHHLDCRKYLINGRKCYYDIMMLLSSGSICQAPNYRSLLEEVTKCSQATVRANNSWNGSGVSRDEVKGAKSQEMVTTGEFAFYSKCRKLVSCPKQKPGQWVRRQGENQFRRRLQESQGEAREDGARIAASLRRQK